MANVLRTEKRIQIVQALTEGCSIRATARMAGCSKNTVAKLLTDLGSACSEYQDETMRGLPCRRVQCDEIWSFCYAKARNVPEDKRGIFGFGDVWTFTAICADSKLVPAWIVGPRDAGTATEFMQDVAFRLANRVQLTTDGHSMYLSAVEDAFGTAVDFAQLQKIYSGTVDGQKRYSPPVCIGVKCDRIMGSPDPKHISTSYVERQNLTMRMSIRRFTRLTNGFSKKLENHEHAIALHFMHYNFCRIHQSLRVTPAMEAGVTDRLWSLEDVVGLLNG